MSSILLSGILSDCQETFQTVRKFSRLSKNFPDSLKTFQNFRKVSKLSGNFPDYSSYFQTVRKSSGLSRNFSDLYVICFDLISNQFCWYAQKLSGRAKTFRSAMPTRRRGFSDSGEGEGSRFCFNIIWNFQVKRVDYKVDNMEGYAQWSLTRSCETVIKNIFPA